MSKPQNHVEPPPVDLDDIADALDSSEADIAAGRTVSFSTIDAIILDRIRKLEAALDEDPSDKSEQPREAGKLGR